LTSKLSSINMGQVGWSPTLSHLSLGRAVPATNLQQLRRVMDCDIMWVTTSSGCLSTSFNISSHSAWGDLSSIERRAPYGS
jgi:hypothetical protein